MCLLIFAKSVLHFYVYTINFSVARARADISVSETWRPVPPDWMLAPAEARAFFCSADKPAICALVTDRACARLNPASWSGVKPTKEAAGIWDTASGVMAAIWELVSVASSVSERPPIKLPTDAMTASPHVLMGPNAVLACVMYAVIWLSSQLVNSPRSLAA